ncbi:hypothetical protein DEU42_11564 [Flavobacterium sp. AG291]|nr:hypothetical protein DEU42_11564 [Flavobacterium sp. AG291]
MSGLSYIVSFVFLIKSIIEAIVVGKTRDCFKTLN